jgi:PAS domain S-box-containing protein
LVIVAHTSNLFLKTNDWKTELDPFLKRLGKTMNASHVYVFENHLLENGELGKSIRYEWSAPSVPGDLGDPKYANKPLNAPEIAAWHGLMKRGLPYIGDRHNVPRSEMDSLRNDGIESLLDVPIFVNGNWWGIIGFDDVLNEREWTHAEVDALIVAANAIGSAIQRQAMDDALKFSEEKFFRAFHSTPVLMTIEDASNHILDVNRAFLDTFEFKREQVLGHSVSDLNIIYELDELAALHKAYETDGRLKNFEIRFHLKNGQAGAALLSTDNFVVDNVSYTLTTGLDITDRKQADVERERLISELESKNEELERFTYTVSHDLKSPLVTINGFIGYLEQDAESGNMERLKKDTKRIQEAVFKMQTLLDELLELSRIGRLMDPPEDVPFEGLVKDALNVVQGRLDQRGVAVHTQPNLPLVHVDKPRLIEVLQNLLDNAAKYMGDQSNPYIEIGQDGVEEDKAIFFVKDNGMGIAPEHHDRIFGLFDKLDAKSEGTGVGLALVKRIIEVHGGSIWVQSEEGLGATFYFTLPATREP